MEHHFEIEVAKEVGVNAAVILYNIKHWIEKNKANGKHFYDGRYWTYNSIKAFEELFPYLTGKMIRGAIEKLKEKGYIITGNYNNSAYDRTLWYALSDEKKDEKKEDCSSLFLKIDLPKKENGFFQKGEPIPNNNTYNKPNNKQKEIIKEKRLIFELEKFKLDNPDKYPELLYKEFESYWTEKSPSGKSRYEAEKFFEVGKRLATWYRNSKDKYIHKDFKSDYEKLFTSSSK